MRVMWFGAVLVIAMGAASCGGSAQPSVETVDAAFRERALAVCQEVLADKQSWTPFPGGSFDPMHADPAKLGVVGEWLADDVATTFTSWREGLVALGTPSTGAASWGDVIKGVTDGATLNDAQVTAARAGDVAAFADATRKITASHAALVKASKAAGVDACGEVVAS